MTFQPLFGIISSLILIFAFAMSGFFTMIKKLTIFIFLLLSLSLFVRSQKVEVRALDAEIKTDEQVVVAKRLDPNAQILQKYLARFDSPLQYHAQDFIDAAKIYNLDWKLLPSIAGVESTFGKFIPGGFNGWGWGVYGTQAIYFASWREAIFTIAQGLRENYFNKGYNEPYSINRIYAASPTWGYKVSYFMNDLEKFEKSYTPEANTLKFGPLPNIAAVSGQIASN